MSSILVVVVAVVAGLAMAWAVGANSNSPPFAPAVAANALPTMRAAFLIGIFAGAGAILQGGNISETVGNDLILNTSITPLAAAAGLLVASGSIAVGVRTGYPIPAAFATTGAMVGVGLSKGGAPAWGTYVGIVTFWALVPPVSGSIAYTTASLLRRDDVPERVGVPLLGAVVGAIVANMSLALVPSPGTGQSSVAGYVSRQVPTPEIAAGFDVAALVTTLAFAALGFAVLRRVMAGSVDRGIRRFLVGLGALVAFSSGGSQVGLATGPLETLFETEISIPPAVPVGPGTVLLALGGLGILAGAWTGATRLLQAVAREYSELGVRRSIAALVPGFIIAQTAIALGIPISFNNIVISSVIGSGLSAGAAGVSRRKIGVTVAGWLATLVAAIGVGFGLYRVLAALTGTA
jgi:phosphate/sulfate permease